MLRIDSVERGLSKRKPDLSRKAAIAAASLPLMANVTAVRFDVERRTSFRISPLWPPSWRSTITASNFRWFNRRIDASTS